MQKDSMTAIDFQNHYSSEAACLDSKSFGNATFGITHCGVYSLISISRVTKRLCAGLTK